MPQEAVLRELTAVRGGVVESRCQTEQLVLDQRGDERDLLAVVEVSDSAPNDSIAARYVRLWHLSDIEAAPCNDRF